MKRLLLVLMICSSAVVAQPDMSKQQRASTRFQEEIEAKEKAGMMIAKFVNESDETLLIKAQTQGGCGKFEFKLKPGNSHKLFVPNKKTSCCVTDFQIFRQGKVNFQIYTSKGEWPGQSKSMMCGKTITINKTWGGVDYNKSGADVTW